MAEDGEFHIVSIDHGAGGWRATLGARSVAAAEAEDALRELCCQELATDPAVWRAVRSREVGEARPTPDLPAVIELVEEIQESADAARGWTGPLSCGRGPQRYEQGYQFPCTHPECIERAATYSYEFARDAAHAANRLAALLSGAASSDVTGWQPK